MIRNEFAVDEAVAAACRTIAADRAIPFLRFEDVRLQQDYGGSDAVYMTAILVDHPQKSTYGWQALKPIDDAVWNEFRERDIERLPYVRFRQEHDVGDADAAADDEDSDEAFEQGS